MALVSASTERINLCGPTDPSSSRSTSEATSSANVSCAADPPDRNVQFSTSPIPNGDVEVQSSVTLRSEEYRQLFRLPSEEVLVQDFNCAFQESILLQGHMYLFVHFICFYSNIFGFETKVTSKFQCYVASCNSTLQYQSCFAISNEFMLQKIIPFYEVTAVRRAKTAGIFPNAIEIFAAGKKYFFASFLSRDEAFKLITDGWLQHGSGSLASAEQQDSSSETSSPQNGPVVIEKVNCCSADPIAKSDSIIREEDLSSDSKLPANVEMTPVEMQDDNVEQDFEPVLDTDSLHPIKTSSWNIENSDAPKSLLGVEVLVVVASGNLLMYARIDKLDDGCRVHFDGCLVIGVPECYTKVAETNFQMKVEDFYSLFFSDDTVNFIESFHRKCGDKGAKFGSCKETQKFRVYRNSHLVIETSQEVHDVPYGDYFRVEGLWDVMRDDGGSKEGCILRVYVNVAFSKKTVWKGKIVQSTLEECRDVYAMWIGMAHDVLKQKNLEKPEGWIVVDSEGGPAYSTVQNDDVHSERVVNTGETSERLCNADHRIRTLPITDSLDASQSVGNLLQGNLVDSAAIASLLRESMTKCCSFVKRQSGVSLILVIAFAVIFLMQVSILVLLNRPQHVHMASPPDYMGAGVGVGLGQRSAESIPWLERRMHYLKDEMLMVEARLERMWHEHAVLRAQLKDIEQLHKRE
ncbi:protein VASCULAR ASSOCIATED DEATH 1 [Citrus sinensis]|uniref:Protein VASCULAR ASSOCIATED DEATH 1 n=1 Tax=Citrus sinensis TaxID=2711 RepID=A0ACB8MTF8_CITSI|nr:protein VASCULAR ASSOCIATED DEATH 1 [Citrus sinensis]